MLENQNDNENQNYNEARDFGLFASGAHIPKGLLTQLNQNDNENQNFN